MKRILFFLFFSSGCLYSGAQNITKIEYFFDSDPGYGAGTDVPITPAASISNHNFSIPLSSAADGFHTLFVRTRDANGNWSAAYSKPFYKLSSAAAPPVPNINKLEYFVDADPGYGAGTNVPVTAGVAIMDLVVAIPVTVLTEGAHTVTFRARDANNNWSVVVIKSFSKCNHPGTTANTAASITSSGFTASWADVPGSISYQLDVSSDNFNTFVSGYNSKVITAPALSTTVTGLSQATAYKYRVRAVSSCASVESNAVNVTTLATPPSAQPTNLLFSSVTSASFTVFFTAPATPPTGYLVVRKTGSSPTFVPVNNTTYTVAQSVGDGVVAYTGTAFLFNESGLTPNTQYFYDVFAYNISGSSISYRTTSPLENSALTKALEPANQPTNLQFANVTDVGFGVSFTAATGNPDGYLVLRKTGSAPTSVPVDGTTYTTVVDTDAVVYNGAATNFTQSGLSQNTAYHYTVFAYNGTGTAINYRTVSPLQGNQLTPITPPSASPSNLVFSAVTQTSIGISYTAPSGSVSGYLVIRKTGSNPGFVPQTNTAYTLGQILSDGVVAYVGPLLTFTDNSLAASIAYYYDVFAYNQTGALIGYQTSAPLEGNKSTFTAEPTAQPSALVFSAVSAAAMTLSFTAASPAPSGYLVLRKAGSSPATAPVDGMAYTQGQTIGDGIVANVGTTTSFIDNGLQPGTNYFYQVFSYNGSGAATNYLTTLTANNTGSKITVPNKPTFAAATNIQQNQFTINWTAVTGAANYRLDVSKDNFVTKVSGFDNVTVTGVSAVVTGLESGTPYKYKLRAVNGSGTSADSDEVQQFTIPGTPVISTSSNVGQTDFTAHWTTVTGATNYAIDVSSVNTFATFLVGYQNKTLGNVTSETIPDLTSGTRYYFRIRASNDGGTSPSSNPIGNQLLIPATPVGLDATNNTSSSFKAKWQSVVGADEYLLDVTKASDNFNPSLPDYTDKSIVGNTEDLVVGLEPNTAYKYRIRAKNSSGTSDSSIPTGTLTPEVGSGSALQLSAPAFTASFSGTTTNTSIEVTGGTPPYSISFYYRKITGSDFTVRPLATTGANHQTTIEASMLDDIGIEFYYKVTDANSISKESAHQFAYQAIPSSGVKIPFTKSGGTAQSYEIFSIPYKIDNDLMGQIFEEMGGIDKSKWRLVRYQGDKNVDISESSKIEPGKGYWFNRKENIDVKFSGGTVVNKNQIQPFELRLEKGWNQIGNPFPFDVDWNDIVEANPSFSSVVDQTILMFDGNSGFKETNVLRTWGGGFVFAQESMELILPVTLKNTFSGGRKGKNETSARLEDPEWFLPITLKQGIVEHAYGGLGMHPEASESKDVFDKLTIPRFVNFLEWNSRHDDFFSPNFTRDIVPTTDVYTWTFTAESNFDVAESELVWDNFSLGQNDAQLFLLDEENLTLIDMKKTGEYKFNLLGARAFKIYFSTDTRSIHPEANLIGLAYPNPMSEATKIPFTLREKQSVQISIYDLTGRKVKEVVNAQYDPGFHTVMWDRSDYAGMPVASGMYLYQFTIEGKSTGTMNKIIVR